MDEYLNRVYVAPDGREAGLYIGYYRSQRQGDAIHSPQNCLPGAGWESVKAGTLTIPIERGTGVAPRRIEVARYVIQKGLDRALVLYWYQSHGRVIAGDYRAKIFSIIDAVRLNRTDAALVRIVTPILDNETETASETRASAFVQSIFPLTGRYLPD